MPRKGAYKFISNNLSCSGSKDTAPQSPRGDASRGMNFVAERRSRRRGGQVANGDHRHRRGRYQNWVNEATNYNARAVKGGWEVVTWGRSWCEVKFD